jgi:hypothetical protein
MTAIADTVLTDKFSKFVTDHNSVKNRLGLNTNNGETSELGAIAFMDKTINTSVTIPTNKGAIGVDTIIPSGINVTVNGTFVVL